MLWSARMINWFAPVAAFVLAVHGTAAWRMWWRKIRGTQKSKRGGIWTIVNVGLCWIFFGFTSLGLQTMHGKQPDHRRALSRATPVTLSKYLENEASIPKGIAVAPAEWVGYLKNVCGDRFHPMVNLHVHVIPEEVWAAYLQIQDGPEHWKSLMDQYRINYVIAQKPRNSRLIKKITNSDHFVQDYEDAQSVVFRRKELIP